MERTYRKYKKLVERLEEKVIRTVKEEIIKRKYVKAQIDESLKTIK